MFHIYHMRRDTMWMDLFRRSYPSRYNALHFLPRVEDIVRIDRDTDERIATSLLFRATSMDGCLWARMEPPIFISIVEKATLWSTFRMA